MSQGTLDRQTKDLFWSVVEDCLVQFHNFRRCDAERASDKMRRRIENAPAGLSTELIYHDEPFDVAGDIAGRHLDLTQKRAEYDAIMKVRNW